MTLKCILTTYPSLVTVLKDIEYILGLGASAVSHDLGGLVKPTLLVDLRRSNSLVSNQTDGRLNQAASRRQVSTSSHLPSAGMDAGAIYGLPTDYEKYIHFTSKLPRKTLLKTVYTRHLSNKIKTP